jgi:hypothetical protein
MRQRGRLRRHCNGWTIQNLICKPLDPRKPSESGGLRKLEQRGGNSLQASGDEPGRAVGDVLQRGICPRDRKLIGEGRVLTVSFRRNGALDTPPV